MKMTPEVIAQYKGVFVFAQQVDNKVSGIAYELLGKAKELAEKLGIDVEIAEKVGIAHDIAKEISSDEKIEYANKSAYIELRADRQGRGGV